MCPALDLANKPVKSYASPCWDEGSLIASDDELRGQLAPHAAKPVMKLMWLCRISRPDVMFIISLLAKQISPHGLLMMTGEQLA